MAGPGKTYTPIYDGRDFYVPAFWVKLGGILLAPTVLRDVIDVSYTDTVGQFDTFAMTVSNWDEEARDFKYTGPSKGGKDPQGRDKLFEPGTEVELWMGHFSPTATAQRDPNKPEPLRLMIYGVIDTVTPTFNNDGSRPTLKISGKNILSTLMNKQETYTYKAGMRDSDIAKEIGNRGNLKVQLSGGQKTIEVRIDQNARSKEAENPEAVLQSNQYDYVFLKNLAKKHEYDLFLGKEEQGGDTTLYLNFGPSVTTPVEYEVEWGKSIISFNPTLDTRKQANEVTVRGWDANRKETIAETATHDDIDIKGMSNDTRLGELKQSFQQNKEIIVDKPFHSKEQAQSYAKAKMTEVVRAFVKASGSTFGTPDLRAGRSLYVKGFGDTFTGTYFLDSTTHTIGANGYVTSFNAHMEEKKQ